MRDPLADMHRFKLDQRRLALEEDPSLAREPACGECLQPVSRCAQLPCCGIIPGMLDIDVDPAHSWLDWSRAPLRWKIRKLLRYPIRGTRYALRMRRVGREARGA